MAGLIHVLGGGPWQVPTVLRCRELGYRVLVTDQHPNQPAIAHADFHEAVDITDVAATLAASRRHGIDGIVCDTTDWGVYTAAFVADAMHLPGVGVEAALNVTNKVRMRRATQAVGLASPRFAVLNSLADLTAGAAEVGLPLVVKPVDNQSGHGVSIVRTTSVLAAAARAAFEASRQGQVILEQALVGIEIIVDGVVVDGYCHVLGIASKAPYTDNTTICSRILYGEVQDLPAPAEAIRQVFRATVTALGLRQGVVHAEFIVHGGSITPIDVAARGGGVLIYRLVVPFVSGVDVNRTVIEQCVGLSPPVQPLARPRCACIEFFRLPPGRLDAWHGAANARATPGIGAVVLNLAAGDEIGALANKDERPGYIVALGETSQEVLASAAAAKSKLRASINGRQEQLQVI